MPEEDVDDAVDAVGAGGDGSTKLSPGRQLGRRAVGGRHGSGRGAHHSSRVYHAPAAITQRRPDDSAYLLLDTDKCAPGASLQRPVAQHGVTADDPPTTNDDQRSLLQNGFVRDRERIYHDNSVIV